MNINIITCFFVIVWLLCGFIALILECSKDMRNKKFNSDYFKNETIFLAIATILMGTISLVIYICCFAYDNRLFTRLIYKICNIGIKKGE